MLIEKFLNLYQQLNAIKNEIKRDEPLPDDNVPKVQKVKIISNAANRSSTKRLFYSDKYYARQGRPRISESMRHDVLTYRRQGHQ